MEEKKPMPPAQPHVLGIDDLASKPECPFDLTLTQQLHLERLSRDVKTATKQELEEMSLSLARLLLVKSNVCAALMKRRF